MTNEEHEEQILNLTGQLAECAKESGEIITKATKAMIALHKLCYFEHPNPLDLAAFELREVMEHSSKFNTHLTKFARSLK
jgi:hypothetical protein